jgi:hypothetical protein
VRAIVTLGPATPKGDGDPTHEAYDNLAAGDCERAVKTARQIDRDPQQSLYRGTGSACLAAFHARSDLWAQAAADLARAAQQQGDFSCWDRGAYQMLAQLVQLHRQDPHRSFTQVGGGGGTSPCPRIRSLVPDHGPMSGGYPVTILGDNLPAEMNVVFGEGTIRATADPGGGKVVIVAPAAGTSGVVDVWIEPVGNHSWEPAAEFTYDAPTSSTETESTGTEPTGTEPTGTEPTGTEPSTSNG